MCSTSESQRAKSFPETSHSYGFTPLCCPHVLAQCIRIGKSFLAFLAFERLFRQCDVSYEPTEDVLGGPLTALNAFERVFSTILALMNGQLRLLGEAFPALDAFERSFSAMNSHVHWQVALAWAYRPRLGALGSFRGETWTSVSGRCRRA